MRRYRYSVQVVKRKIICYWYSNGMLESPSFPIRRGRFSGPEADSANGFRKELSQ